MKKYFALMLGFGFLVLFILNPLSFSQSYLEEVQACECLGKGDINKALRLLNTKLRRYPGNLDCHLYLGLAYYLQGDLEKAKKTLDKVEFETEKMEGSSSAVTAGQSYANVDQISQRRGIVFTKGRRGILKFSLGMLYKQNKDYKNARKRFSDALKYKYSENEARKQLLVTYAFLKDHKKAEGELKKLRKSGEESEALSFMEGYIAYHRKKQAQAVDILSKLAETVPMATRTLATIHYNQGDHQKALEIWDSLLTNSPESADLLRNSGRALFHLGQKEEAQNRFDKAGLKLKPENYSPKKIPLFLVDLFTETQFDFQCSAKNK